MPVSTKKKTDYTPTIEEIKIFLGWIKQEYGEELILSFLAKMIQEHLNFGLDGILNELAQLKKEHKK